MKYFLHDTSAFDDEKITMLYIKFGYEGLGLFYTTLEKLAKQEKPVNTGVLKVQLKVGKRLEKCWKFMEEIGILSSSNGETFNEQLLNFSEKYQIKKEKTRKKVAEWREKQTDKKDVTGYVPVSNPRKVKESKVKESKRFTPPSLDEVKQYCIERKNGVNADRFINFYESKGWMVGKNKMKDWKAAVRNWEKDTKAEKKLPDHIQAQKEKNIQFYEDLK